MSPGNLISPLLSRSVSLVQGRPRQRSSEPAPRKAQIRLGLLLPGYPSLVATTARRPDPSVRHLISGSIRNRPVQTPIDPAAALRPISRGFLP
jgi:hypothetical protein